MSVGDEFENELTAQIDRALRQGRPHIEVNAGELHRVVGGYPAGGAHRMPVCCSIMRGQMGGNDAVVYEPEKGEGASLTIRYQLPR